MSTYFWPNFPFLHLLKTPKTFFFFTGYKTGIRNKVNWTENSINLETIWMKNTSHAVLRTLILSFQATWRSQYNDKKIIKMLIINAFKIIAYYFTIAPLLIATLIITFWSSQKSKCLFDSPIVKENLISSKTNFYILIASGIAKQRTELKSLEIRR